MERIKIKKRTIKKRGRIKINKIIRILNQNLNNYSLSMDHYSWKMIQYVKTVKRAFKLCLRDILFDLYSLLNFNNKFEQNLYHNR